jgi:hypothetical protein
MIARLSQTNLTRQAPEDAMNVLMQQRATAFRDEEVRAPLRGQMGVAQLGVVAQHGAGRRMQGHEPRLPKLGQSNRQHVGVQVDIVTLEVDCLGQTHARHRYDSEQAVVCPAAQCT